MLKRLFSLVLVIAMLFTGVAHAEEAMDEEATLTETVAPAAKLVEIPVPQTADEEDEEEAPPQIEGEDEEPPKIVGMRTLHMVEDKVGFQPGTQVNVVTATEMAGFFATDMWGNNTADMDVRMLLHGYTTIAKQHTMIMAADLMAVKNIVLNSHLADGNLGYTFTLNEEMVYNDGSPVTAKDYLFALLLSCSPHITELGGMSRDYDHIAGYAEYRDGTNKAMSGLRLIDDQTFSIEILPESLPYFHDLSMLTVSPYPMAVIAPECEIVDDGEGVYIDGDFTVELLRKTLLDPETGYLFNPRVTSGPFQLESYDKKTHTATFTANEKYLGNYEGKKPNVERIVYTTANNADVAELLKKGEVDIVHKVVDRSAYEELSAMVDEELIREPHSYLRSGFGYLAFACEQGPTASVAVRNAIARCIDKKAFVETTFAEDMALPVYGYYGMAQWMVAGMTDVDGEATPVTEALEMLNPPFDVESAKALLAEDGWTLNASAGSYVEGKDSVRYRKGKNGLEALNIKWAKIRNNATADAIAAALKEPFKELGIGLEITEMDLSEMLRHYYRMEERTYDMFNMASNFTYVFDPYYDFNTGEEYQGWINCSGLRDEMLMDLAWDLRRTESWDTGSYMRKWLAFQERWIEMMPMVPLYSNVYFDFIAKDIQDYAVEGFATLAQALSYVYIADEPITDESAEALMPLIAPVEEEMVTAE